MKKIIGLLACLFLVVSVSAFAADGDPWTSGASGAGGAMTFNPSTSTSIDAYTDPTSFEIISGSAKNDVDNGMEYGIVSWSNAVYQRALTADKTVVTATGAIVTADDTYKTKAGDSCPDS